jgi:predicted pyridoxine 5'-phosphate oxidase superfamily flavin-nucleotide-binding protein
LKHFLPDSYTEMRLKERQLAERMTRYEQTIVEFEKEKMDMMQAVRKKDEDVFFIKSKYEEDNKLWHAENIEKQKLESIVEQ